MSNQIASKIHSHTSVLPRNIKLSIEYLGSDYCGWQIQNQKPIRGKISKSASIQENLENILSRILQEKIKVIGSGRTDAGVHAVSQVANFKTRSHMSLSGMQKALNGLLPKDIAVGSICEVASDFHSRFAAKSKIYSYVILNSPVRSVFLKDISLFLPYRLNVGLMQKESRCLLGRHDFKSFCASGSSVKDTIRTIKRISISKRAYPLFNISGPLIIVEIEADGFLYNMVRNIVGTLIEVGMEKLPAGSLRKILTAKDRKLAGPTAPAKGLFLTRVAYEEKDRRAQRY